MGEDDLYKIIFDEIQYQLQDEIGDDLIQQCAEGIIEVLKRDLLILKEFIYERGTR